MKVYLLAHTASPEKIVAGAAKLCYSNADAGALTEGLSEEKAKEFVGMLASMGHESPTEHASFTFAIDGVSRALLAQITRHRIASYSVQSQRYVRLEDFDYITPPAVEADEAAKTLFEQSMARAAREYKELALALKKKHKAALTAAGVPEKQAASQAEKKAIEDARFVLPGACATKMIVTMNARSLNNFFRQRCCTRAQWEIRALADEMLRLVCGVAPALFAGAGPPCVSGPCPEGKMSCGQSAEVKRRYDALREAGHAG